MNIPSRILMIEPVLFGFNEQTSASNSFQNSTQKDNAEIIQKQALEEFNHFVSILKENDVDIVIIQDTPTPHTPDSIFPNNWISFHDNDTIVLYPMLAPNRRLERREDIISLLSGTKTQIIDLSSYEKNDLFLEGTGSVVFDYNAKIAYANTSPRTDIRLLTELANNLKYKTITFKAVDSKGADIYHTNVLMCIGNTFAVLCNDCIPNESERQTVISSLENTGHELILISTEQMNSFAGNMYQLFDKNGNSLIIMSEQARQSLNKVQTEQLKKHGKIVSAPLDMIETYGGGSARCMLADIRLPKN